MKRWDKDDEYEKFEKFGKMRRGIKNPKKGSGDLKKEFILKESKWTKDSKYFTARVVEVHKRYAFVSKEPEIGEIDTKDVWLATIAKKYLTAERQERNFICVGDRVLCRPAEKKEMIIQSDLPQCVIQNLAPRTAKIARIDPSDESREHVLASNIDQLVIVGSYLNPNIKWGLIDRYLVLAEDQGIRAVIILNKADLLEDEPELRKQCDEREQYLQTLGYQVYRLAATDKNIKGTEAFQELVSVLDKKVSLISGHSGVGKSTIVNLFEPEIVQEVEPDDDIFYKGRHTTSYASFIKLATGGYIIDTPGVRSFVLEDFKPTSLSYCFKDVRAYSGQCKFRECSHVDEPDCAVMEAVEDGKIPIWRYKSYVGILLKTTGRQGRLRDVDIEGA